MLLFTPSQATKNARRPDAGTKGASFRGTTLVDAQEHPLKRAITGALPIDKGHPAPASPALSTSRRTRRPVHLATPRRVRLACVPVQSLHRPLLAAAARLLLRFNVA